MYEALMEIMEPKLRIKEMEWEEKGRKKGLQEGLKNGICGMVETLRDFGHDDDEIKAAIIKKYGLSVEEIEEYL